MPSKIIQKVEDVVSEGLNKPVRIQYDNYRLNIRVFHKEIPEEMGLVYTISDKRKMACTDWPEFRKDYVS